MIEPVLTTVDIKFKNSGEKEINDVVYGSAFELKNIYQFIISPRTKFWRFGLVFSKSDIVKLDPSKRYDFSAHRYLQVAVGDMLEKSRWILPNKIELGNMETSTHPFSVSLNYHERSLVELNTKYDLKNEILYVSYQTEGCELYQTQFSLTGYKYFWLVGWADWCEFEVDVKVNEYQVADYEDTESLFSAIKVGNIIFRHGDMFDYDILPFSSIILLPASTNGTFSPNIRNRAAELGIPNPPKSRAGSISLFPILSVKEHLYAGYAYSVDENSSSYDIIQAICESLRDAIQSKDAIRNQVVSGVNLPLLGTGAGNLNPLNVALVYDNCFNSKSYPFPFIVSIQRQEEFQNIKEVFKSRYIPVRQTSQQIPQAITYLENILNIPLRDSFSVDQDSNVTRVTLNNIQLKDLSFLPNFPNLRTLDLSGCRIGDYSHLHMAKDLQALFLSGNGIGDISFLSSLSNIRILDLSSNGLEDITRLRHLSELITLDISYNRITDIKPLEELHKLESLSASNNYISDISSLGNLVNLNYLNISKNKITKFDILSRLSLLFVLDISFNNVEDFFPLLKLRGTYHLKANGNPFFMDRNLVLEESENQFPAVRNYLLRQLDYSKQEIVLPAKVLLLGNHSTGKSSLLEFLQSGELPKSIESTHIIRIERYPKSDADIPKAIFFDFGGQDYYHGIYRAFLSAGSVYLILWCSEQNCNRQRIDSNNILTLDFKLNYWLCQKRYLETEKFKDRGPIFIIQSHSDRDGRLSYLSSTQDHMVENEFYISLANPVLGNGDGVERIKTNKYALEYLKQSIIELIESRRIKKQEPSWYIKFLQFILTQNSIGDHRARSLSEDIINYYERTLGTGLDLLQDDLDQLNKQGLVLYHRDKLPDVAWLNPVALVEYVHTEILNRKRIIELKGVVPIAEFDKYDKDIVNLLCFQKVLFRHTYGDNGEEFIVPNYLPLADENKSDFNLFMFDLSNLQFCLKFKDFLPFGLINQIICFFGTLPDRKLFWRDQLVFTFQRKAKILIRIDFNNLEIKIYASFIESVLGEEKGLIKKYLFYAIISLYWDFEPLQYDDFLLFTEGKLSKNDFLPGDPRYLRIHHSERIYEIEACRPADLFVSLDDKIFINYSDLCKSNDMPVVDSYSADDHRNLSKLSRPISIYPFQFFTNRSFARMKKLFISYSKHDEDYKEEFRKHLVTLKDQGLVDSFNCKQIDLGADWDSTIQREVDECDIMICLISVDFLNTAYIRTYEVAKAIAKGKKLIPIIIKPCDWEDSEIGKFYASLRGQTISLNKELFLREEIKENSAIERAAFWTRIVKEFREKIFRVK